ncbi:MAG: hypothetical protein Harvfovirus87_3 [Harvfovirus sp.]|uniref:Uncharacterized protein n=1 Tax=Harvfovirus sp. TaxID=2487768 RepID=A0A3G5A4C0_9VIRU|nr:MAG: hypothetical protein Harvfovirus87_3 [Harvfovirus sp.]
MIAVPFVERLTDFKGYVEFKATAPVVAPVPPPASAPVPPPVRAPAPAPMPTKISIGRIGTIDEAIKANYKDVAMLGLAPSDLIKQSFGLTKLFVSLDCLFIPTVKYEAYRKTLPLGFDPVPRGGEVKVFGLSFTLTEPDSLTALQALRSKGVDVVFLDKVHINQQATKILLDFFGYKNPTVWSYGDLTKGAYVKSRITSLGGGCVFVLDTSSSHLDTFVSPAAFSPNRVVLMQYTSSP